MSLHHFNTLQATVFHILDSGLGSIFGFLMTFVPVYCLGYLFSTFCKNLNFAAAYCECRAYENCPFSNIVFFTTGNNNNNKNAEKYVFVVILFLDMYDWMQTSKLFPARISNPIPKKVKDEITYPCWDSS